MYLKISTGYQQNIHITRKRLDKSQKQQIQMNIDVIKVTTPFSNVIINWMQICKLMA